MVTILTEHGRVDVGRADGGDDRLWLRGADVAGATGWELKPEGFCRGPVCVPIPPGRAGDFTRGEAVDVAAFWRHMGTPALHDSSGETWLLGEGAAERTARLSDLEAPDFALPDLDGRMHALSDYRGKKVLLATWASW